MAYTKASGKAVNKYSKKAYDRLNIIVPKGKREVIKTYAESKGLSLNAYINSLIDADMQNSSNVE